MEVSVQVPFSVRVYDYGQFCLLEEVNKNSSQYSYFSCGGGFETVEIIANVSSEQHKLH